MTNHTRIIPLEDFPNIIVENHLEYDPNIIGEIMYFVTKAPGN